MAGWLSKLTASSQHHIPSTRAGNAPGLAHLLLPPQPASGSLRTPLAARRVPRPASLPVVAGPYIRCPPALHPAASAMLSRSRCVSRAFSRSLSAFQKVLSGGAGAPAGSEAGCGRTGELKGRGAGQAGHQGHRDAEAADALGAAPPRVPSPAILGVSLAARAGRFLLSGTLTSGAGSRTLRDIDSELARRHGPQPDSAACLPQNQRVSVSWGG